MCFFAVCRPTSMAAAMAPAQGTASAEPAGLGTAAGERRPYDDSACGRQRRYALQFQGACGLLIMHHEQEYIEDGLSLGSAVSPVRGTAALGVPTVWEYVLDASWSRQA